MTEDPRLLRAAARLLARLQLYVQRPIDRETLLLIDRLIKDHAMTCRMRGIDFPQMTAFFLPRHGIIALYRKDLEHVAIQRVIGMVANAVPAATADELAEAVFRAWPDYRGAKFDIKGG